MRKYIFFLFFITCPTLLFAQNDSLIISKANRDFIIYKNKIEITISIHKPNLSGFAKIYEKLPSNSQVKEVKCGSAYYKAEKNMLKIAWDNIPEDSLIKINYTITLSEGLTDTMKSFQGVFAAEYMTNEHEQIIISSGNKSYYEEPILIVQEKIKKEETSVKKYNSDLSNQNSQSSSPITKTTDTYICIQVAAVGTNINTDYLSKKFGYSGEYDVHFEDNFYRITIGKYNSINEAQTAMNDLKSKYFNKCFLSAYSNGNKIPVYKAQNMLN